MSTARGDVHVAVRAQRPEHLARIRTFLMQPSVSRENRGVRECAELLLSYFQALGCQEAEIAETPGLPSVWAAYDAGAPKTLAVYGYFDSNIVGTGWDHDPYAGVVTARPPFKEVLYGRGGQNKGGLIALLNALFAIKAVEGTLPVNLMFVCEGEEFVGSLHMPLLIDRYRRHLSRADGVLSPGPCQSATGEVMLSLGNKGCLHIELTCSGDRWGRGPIGGPVHSSTMGVVDHPAWRLVRALSTLYDPDEHRILVDGFTDRLREPSEDDLALIDALAERYAGQEASVVPGIGTPDRIRTFVNDASGAEVFRRYCFMPTMNINGLRAGYTGPGTTLWTLPAAAHCTIDHRLPPDLDPDVCARKIREHLDRQGYDDIDVDVLMSVGAQSLPLQDDLAQAALRMFRARSVDPVVWPRRGASGPTGYFAQMLGLKVLGSTGMGYASGHSEGNEFLVVEGDGRVGGLVELELSFVDLLYSYAAYPGDWE